MASQQPVTPPRRSSRIANRPPRRVPWLWSPGSASSSRVEEVDPFDQEDQITKLLRNMYQEIDETATTPPDGDFLSRIYTLIRRIRSRRFWSEAEDGYRIDLDRSKAFAASERASIENALAHFTEDIQDSPDIQDEFLAHMVETYGYPLLSICLHSSSFLRLTETGNLDLETKLNKNEWTRIRMRLELIAASLELFAKLRRLDFMAPIRHYEADYKLLLSNVFRKHNSVDRCRNFGISPDEMNEVHIVEPWDIAGKHWALPEKRAEPAEICCIKYTVTQHLNEDYPELAVGEELTEPQEDIQDSIFLGAYRWVNLTQWPSDDPRESGYEDPCLCCGYQRGPVPKRRDGARYPQGCECTFEDLQRKQKSLVGQPLFEIMTSSFLGRCVRALQNLRTGDYLGIYHGEMYPFFKKTEHERRGQEHLEDERTGPRYSGNVNSSYILRQDLDRRHVKNRSKRKTTKKRPRNTGSDDEVTAREMEELDPREWRVYAIDAALKGNFTRFLAHSCDANTRFEEICLAQKKVNVLEVIRPIQFGDSITVDYGDEYFEHEDYGCRCGMSNCIHWTTDNIDSEFRTLAQAIKDGDAPDWADSANFPIEASEEGNAASREQISRRKRQVRQQARADQRSAGKARPKAAQQAKQRPLYARKTSSSVMRAASGEEPEDEEGRTGTKNSGKRQRRQ